jgi:hypothetical protein
MTCRKPLWLLVISLLVVLPAVGRSGPLPHTTPTPGGIAVVTLPDAASTPPLVHYEGNRVMVRQHDRHWVAIVGLPLEAQPGVHTLQVQRGSRPTQAISFTVHAKEYAVQHITLKDRRMVDPTDEDLQRIAREKTRIEAAFAHWSEATPRDLTFVQPVAGDFSSPFGLRRFFNNQPRKPHSGLDIAAPPGTPCIGSSNGIFAPPPSHTPPPARPSRAAIAAAPARSGSEPQPGGARKVEGGRIQTGLQTRRGVVRSRDTPLLHARRPRGHARRCEPVGCTAHRTGGEAT